MLPSGYTNDVRNAFAYAYQFDAFLYARYLRQWAEARGIERVEGRIVEVEQDGATGDIAAVKLASGARIAGDLFVVCSGFCGLLMARTLGVGVEDWLHSLPCDSAAAVPSARSADFHPYSRSTRSTASWHSRTPDRKRTLLNS